jgi:hypothetical protein
MTDSETSDYTRSIKQSGSTVVIIEQDPLNLEMQVQ